jgi:hypothetical protein
MCPDPASFQIAPYVEVVEQCSPGWIAIEDCMGEPDEVPVHLTADSGLIHPRRLQALRPSGLSLWKDVAVEVGVQVRASIMTTPTIGVQGGDGPGIVFGCLSIAHVHE